VSRHEHRVPIVEERVHVDKKLVESGIVKISTSVSEHTEIVSAALMHEEIEIERVPMDIELEQAPDIRYEGELLVIPIVEERPVVVKRLVLVEELRVRRKVVHEDAELPVELRRTQVQVRREAPPSDTETN